VDGKEKKDDDPDFECTIWLVFFIEDHPMATEVEKRI